MTEESERDALQVFIGLMEDQIGLALLALKDHAMAAVIREKRLLINRPVTVNFSVVGSCDGLHVAVFAEAWTEAVYGDRRRVQICTAV